MTVRRCELVRRWKVEEYEANEGQLSGALSQAEAEVRQLKAANESAQDHIKVDLITDSYYEYVQSSAHVSPIFCNR